MKEIIKIEIKRIIRLKNLLVIIGFVFMYSIISSINAINQYHVYDSSNQRILSARENLSESKKHQFALDEEMIKDTVARKNTNPHLYNRLVSTLIAANYDVYVEDLSADEIETFYSRWIAATTVNSAKTLSQKDIKSMEEMVARIPVPIQLGYAEGWKNVNDRMVDIVTSLVLITPFLVIPLFAKDPKTNMTDLCTATKYGKKDLTKARIIAGFTIASIIYVIALSIFALTTLLFFGFDGANLPIQSSLHYFFSPINLTYFQQFLWNACIGWAALLTLITLTLLVSVISKKVLTAALVLVFIIAIMILTPMDSNLHYYIGIFFPHNMTNFTNYYASPFMYHIFGSTILPHYMAILVSTVVVSIFTTLTVWISLKSLKQPLK